MRTKGERDAAAAQRVLAEALDTIDRKLAAGERFDADGARCMILGYLCGPGDTGRALLRRLLEQYEQCSRVKRAALGSPLVAEDDAKHRPQ